MNGWVGERGSETQLQSFWHRRTVLPLIEPRCGELGVKWSRAPRCSRDVALFDWEGGSPAVLIKAGTIGCSQSERLGVA